MTKFGKIVAVGATASAVFVLFWFDPAATSFYPRCLFHSWTGLDCPFCGTTRALHQLLHGNVGAAFRFNALAISLLPLVGYLATRGDRGGMKPVWIWGLLGVVIAFGVLRNVSVHPFTLLTP
jgi:hypothetical protein